MVTLAHWQLRSMFALRLSRMYGEEVPAYNTLLEVSQAVNQTVLARDAAAAQRLGTIERVTAERHGAIRVGTPIELAQVARVFGALGMFPVGFYDLRDASSSAVPVVSTAFRPIDEGELARNPFRVFTSMLAAEDRRFFSAELQGRIEEFLSMRTLFSQELLELADRSVADGGLDERDAEAFLDLAVTTFEISREPVNGPWYRELERISAVAADIAGVASTHINHLTPRVLDIDDLYRRMQDRGLVMIDDIQGPPRWDGPDVLLRQTSFRALAEPRRFREADGSVVEASLRVRFGEVEARGIALTRSGRAAYDEAIAEIDARLAAQTVPGAPAQRQTLAADVWRTSFPDSERGLRERDFAYFIYRLGDGAASARRRPGEESTEARFDDLLRDGLVIAEPIVYEDFLPRSAAGIFQSNLTDSGTKDERLKGTVYDIDRLSEIIGTQISDPTELYARQSDRSREAVLRALH